jgi:hypothetical protein
VYHQGDVKELTHNTTYRISDLVYRLGVRWEQDRQTILSDQRFRGTILHRYLTEMKHEEDFTTLRIATQRRSAALSIDQARDDELVVHLRLGDVMETAKHLRTPRLRKMAIIYDEFAGRLNLDMTSIRRATIVTALHFGANDQRGRFFASDTARRNSLSFLNHVAGQFIDQGLAVRLRSSDNIDADFCFMASSRHFLLGQSGMSDLIAHCLDPGARTYDAARLQSPDFRVGRHSSWFPGPWLGRMHADQ